MPDVLVPRMLAERAAAFSDGVALRLADGPSLTFGEWQRRSGGFASGLVERGVQPGDRIALRFDERDWPGFAVAYVGTLRAGAVAVPLSPRLTDAEVTAAVDGSGCRELVTEALAGQGSADVPVPDTALAQILHSSGSTGMPKRVAASHRNVLAGWRPGTSEPHDPGAVFVHATPIATNAGQVTLLHPLLDRHTCVLLPRFDAARYCAVVEEQRAEHTLLTPAMATWLVQSEAHIGHDLTCVRTVVLTSAPISAALLARVAETFPAAGLVNSYTSTEAWPAMTAMAYDPERAASIGRPLDGQEVAVLSPAGERLEAGQTGEIALRTASDVPARTYLDDPAATERTFAGGWVRTGDVGYLDDGGFLYLVDRQADLINAGGSNVSTLEVEAALDAESAVAEAAVVGTPHETLGEVVAAAVVLHEPITADELRDALRTRLAEHKVPVRIEFVERLPRNALGKVVKPELRRALTAPAAAAPVPPRSPDEELLLCVWTEVLGLDGIGVEDDFVAVGGHSLAAFEIAERAAIALRLDLPRNLILARPTVAEQAAAVAALRRDAAPPGPAAIPIRRRPRP